MKLLKPAFVHNQERPIFSIDIHPKEQKFATVRKATKTIAKFSRHKLLTQIPLDFKGGQGTDSGRVTIWNLEPVLSEKAEMDPKVPKILCQM